MLLRLIEVEGDYHHERDLPDSDNYTIGRGGDVRPTIDADMLLSRIAVTVQRKEGKAVLYWKVINGTEDKVSTSGLWISETERTTQYTLSEVGQSVDLICPTFGLPTIKIIVASDYRKDIDYPRDTKGFELEILTTLHEEMASIKHSFKEQEKFRNEQRQVTLSQVDDICEIKRAISDNQVTIKEISELVKTTVNTNNLQDEKIKNSGLFSKILAAIVAIGLASAMMDGKNREIILQSTAGLLLAGCTLTMATKERT